MKTRKIPKGYEVQTVEWTVDLYESCTYLSQNCPKGWQFFELVREGTKATVTYIRPKEKT
jgi:hypothetical protein